MTAWLAGEGIAANEIGTAARRELVLKQSSTRGSDDDASPPVVAVSLRDAIVLDTGKWFGGARIRLDALVVHGNTADGATIYAPRTLEFSHIESGNRLPLDLDAGILLFLGRPAHFLDIFIMASRVKGESPSLGELLISRGGDITEVTTDVAKLAGLATEAVLTAALTAAFKLGDVALAAISAVTESTIGLYRASFLEHRHQFGLGRHPDAGYFEQKDLRFYYEIGDE